MIFYASEWWFYFRRFEISRECYPQSLSFRWFVLQPSSPRGQKRGKRVSDVDESSEDEAEPEDGEPNHKRGKHESAVIVETGAPVKGTPRGGRKSVDKNGSAKISGKKPQKSEIQEDNGMEVEENTSAKRKRGRPKSTGKKEGMEETSGADLAGPSTDTTPTTSVKKGKSPTGNQRSLLEFVQKKPGRPAKMSEDGSTRKKEKVIISSQTYAVIVIPVEWIIFGPVCCP